MFLKSYTFANSNLVSRLLLRKYNKENYVWRTSFQMLPQELEAASPVLSKEQPVWAPEEVPSELVHSLKEPGGLIRSNII